MSEKLGGEGASRAKLALEIGGAAGAAVLAGAGAYLLWRKRRQEDGRYEPNSDFEPMLKIFEDEQLDPGMRRLLAPVAVRIQHATFNSESNIIEERQLSAIIGKDDTLDCLRKVLDCLEQAGLIDARPSSVDSRIWGYYAQSPLNWAVEAGNISSLADAHHTLLGQLTSSL